MSILSPGISADIDPGWVGLLDAKLSGWFLKDSGELFRGFQITENDSVLDVGCGDGVAALFCAEQGAHVTISDIDAGTVKSVEQKLRDSSAAGRYASIVCDSDPLLVPDAFATRIICQEVLEHVSDPGRVVAELCRAGEPGAQYLLTVPGEQSEQVQKSFAPADYYEYPNHIRVFGKNDFIELVEGAGLEVDSYTTNGFYSTFWVSMQWAITAAKCRENGEQYSVSHDPFKPPYDDSLQRWAVLWGKMISTPEGELLKKEMDKLLPKVQVILARKPR